MSIAQAQTGEVATGGAIISEFRFRGATGSADEYVEVRSKANAPLNISGWSIQTRTAAGLQTTLVPPNTIVPVFGHFLFTGSGYSLTGYGSGDVAISGDILDDSGVALLNAVGAVQDAVGFAASDAGLREGAGLPSAPTANGEYAFMRDFVISQEKDTSDSSSDFVFVSTSGANVAGTAGDVVAQLGAPSPEGLLSPSYFNNQTLSTLLDPSVASNVSPNRVRLTGGGTLGTLIVRRTIKNNSLVPVTRLRFSVVSITSLNSAGYAGAQADVRLVNAPAETGVLLADGTTSVNTEGTTLEAGTGQPQQSLGGGLGSSLNNFTVTLATPLNPGVTRNFNFRLQIERGGTYFITLNILALTPPSEVIDLTASLGNGQATLDWTPISGATSYKIERKVDGGTYAELSTHPLAATYTDTGLTNGVTYFYRVYAVNDSGTSAASNEVSVTPAVVVRGVDLSVGAGTTLVGANVFYPTEQKQQVDCGPGAPAIFRLVVTNSGNTRDTFRLSGRGDTPGWKVRYFNVPTGGSEISSLVKPNGYLVTLAGGASRELRIEVTPDASVPQNEEKLVPVSARSESDTLYLDQVTAQAVQTNVPPPPPTITRAVDASIRLASAATYNGAGVVTLTTPDASQTVEGAASSTSAAVYHWRVQNTGTDPDTLRLTLPATPNGWMVNLFDALDGGTNITASAQGGGYVTASIAPGAFVEMRLEVKGNAGTEGSLLTNLTAASGAQTNVTDVCAAITTVYGTTTDSPSVTFSGPTRAVAGGLGDPLHQTTLTLTATQGGAPVPTGTSFTLSFENNVGHNYGTASAPNIPHRAKIYDANDPTARWKETLTVTVDANGQVPVTLLSSDVISQPRLIASYTSAGYTETVGGAKFDCAAAVSKRGVIDPVDPEDPDWQANDTGWSVEIGNIEKPSDTCNGSVTMQFQDAGGTFQRVTGHTLRMRIAKISLSSGQDVYDIAEMGRYLKFLSSGQESGTFTGVTDANGVLRFSLKGMNEIDGIKGRALSFMPKIQHSGRTEGINMNNRILFFHSCGVLKHCLGTRSEKWRRAPR